jgi:hypothetical protein
MTRKEAEAQQKEAAQRRAEHEAEIQARERERLHLERQTESEITAQLEKLRIRHEAQKRLNSEITRQHPFDLPKEGWTADDFLEESEEAPEPVIAGLHYRGNNTLLVAEYKTGKTTLEINLARALVDGVPFLGQFETHLPYGKVAFLNYEMHKNQFRHWLNQTTIENTDRIVPLNLRGWNLPFWDDKEMNRMAEWLLKNEVGFIIMDPAARAWRGLVDNEGDNIQLSAFFGAIDELKRLGDVSNLLLAVHTPRDTESGRRARGGGEIEAWPDGNWYLSKVRGSRMRAMEAEGRDIDLPETALEFDEDTRELTATGTTTDLKIDQGVKEAVAAVKEHGVFEGTKSFVQALKGSGESRRKSIKIGVERGLIKERIVGQKKLFELGKTK